MEKNEANFRSPAGLSHLAMEREGFKHGKSYVGNVQRLNRVEVRVRLYRDNVLRSCCGRKIIRGRSPIGLYRKNVLRSHVVLNLCRMPGLSVLILNKSI
jgi:hypothetical protein